MVHLYTTQAISEHHYNEMGGELYEIAHTNHANCDNYDNFT